MRITAAALAGIQRAVSADVEPFAVYQPTPGVIRRGEKPQALAMDAGEVAVLDWAGAGVACYSDGETFLGFPYLAMLAQKPEYRRITEIIAKEMTRRWVKVVSTGDADEAKLKEITAELERFKVQAVFREVMEHDGFFGRGHIAINTGDNNVPETMQSPLVLDRRTVPKGSLKGFKTIEPVWVYPNAYNSSDPLDLYYYRPQSWFVQGRLIHTSRLLTFVGREVPDLLKPAYSFGGLSMSQLAKPYVDNWIRTRQSVSNLLHSFSKTILKTNMGAVLQGGGAEDLVHRAQMFALTRDNRDLIMIDKDSEEIEDVSTPLNTLDKLQAQSQEQMASVSGIPLVVLLGITPSGLNASSDGEIKTFYAWIKSQQEALFTDPLLKILALIQLNLYGDVDASIGVEFNPLWEEDDATRATTQKTKADTDAIYLDQGVVAPNEVRQRLKNDPESPYSGLDLASDAPGPPEPDVPDDMGVSGGEEDEA